MTALVVAGLSIGPAMPTVAYAQSVTKQVEELSGQAATAYRDGDYKKAIELFQQAYALQQVPNLLFNIAKVYEKLQDWDNAIANYKEFIKAPDADSGAREVALERIDTLDDVREKELAAKKAEEQRLAEQQQQQQTDQTDQQQQQTEEVVPPQETSGGNTIAWVVAGSGVALLVGGGVFGLLASDQETVFKSAETSEERRAARKNGLTYAVTADAMFAAGAIATAVGIVLFATSGSDEAEVSSAPLPFGWVGEGEAGVGMQLRY